MRLRYVLPWAVTLAVVAQWGFQAAAQSQDVTAAYERSASFGRRTDGLVVNVVQTPVFIEGGARLWYRKSVTGGNAFVLVDVAAKSKAAAFDHTRLAAALSAAASAKYTAVTLPFTTFTFADEMRAIEFSIGGGAGRAGGGGPAAAAAPAWRCTLADYTCARTAAAPQSAQSGGGGGRAGGSAGAQAEAVRNSPDGRWQALIQNYNIFVRPMPSPGGQDQGQAAGAAQVGFMLSTDGSEGNAYTFGSLRWSPDSRKIAVFRRRPGYERLVHYVESSPADQVQPKHTTNFYRKPGDVVDFDHPVLFNVETRQQLPGDLQLFPNPYANSRLEWRADSRAVTFEYNQRGHQIYRVIEIDAATGRGRALIEEAPKTFVEYSGKRFREDAGDGKEIVWASERDGWNHLYLYDGVTGQVKNQITKGEWVVRAVTTVDAAARQIWFTASGMHAGRDPYFIHHYRVNFDGTGLTALTDADGNHAVTFSADKQFYVDSWQRVDLPQQSVLRRTSDQSLVMELEKGDASALLATGWKYPEVFTAKARDGVTDIWGIIIRPTNFDPSRTYPVIENIYAGPQGSFVPKTFSTQGGMNAIAELGFIVIQVDGMGTSNRSKAFHDVAWRNLGDAGFPDRILWHKAVAAKYPNNYDLTRVGIYGTSAGGQNAAGAVLFHPEFYHVAYSNSGCHDNRMDKIWWNEQWMGWPIASHYAASSNVDHAHNLTGRLMLLVPEMDTNVDPASTMQVAHALIRANKTFELVVVPGANHGAGGAFSTRKRNDWFVKHLLGIDPPNWNVTDLPAAGNGDAPEDEEDEIDYVALERAPFFPDRGLDRP